MSMPLLRLPVGGIGHKPAGAAPRRKRLWGSAEPEKACIYCGHPLGNSARSLQVRCPSCSQYVSLQDLVLSGEVQTPRTATAGAIDVTPTARIAGDVVGGRVVVRGRVMGNVIALQDCIVTATGKIAGAILCRNLRMEPGAEVIGQIEVVRGQ
jgi:hypothetical protein